MRDYRFHCEDCDSYSQCQYYHNRKGTSLICKEFQHGSSVIEQIRAEIDQKQYDFMDDKDYDEGIRFGLMLAYQIIDNYR
jgi:hypothetical protein